MSKAHKIIRQISGLKSRLRGGTVALLLAVFVIFSSLAVLVACGASVPVTNNAAQTSITGEWLTDFSRKNPEEVQFTIVRSSEHGGHHSSSNGIPLSELQGLTRDQAFAARSDVNFRLAREAGTFLCEGTFKEGKGTGFWTLTINQSFVSGMRARGYDNLTEEDLFTAAVIDVTTKSVDDLKAAGYDHLSFKDLVEANIFKVTGEFIREMRAAGFDNLSLKDLVEARIFKIDSQYVKEVEAMGFGHPPLKKLVDMRIHKITPEFIAKMRSMGFDNLSIKELTDLSVHNVTPEFVNGIKAEGFTSISPSQAVELRIFGVDRDFIRRVRAKGFNDVTLKQLVDLRIHNVIK